MIEKNNSNSGNDSYESLKKENNRLFTDLGKLSSEKEELQKIISEQTDTILAIGKEGLELKSEIKLLKEENEALKSNLKTSEVLEKELIKTKEQNDTLYSENMRYMEKMSMYLNASNRYIKQIDQLLNIVENMTRKNN